MYVIRWQILDGGVPEGEKINKKIIICD